MQFSISWSLHLLAKVYYSLIRVMTLKLMKVCLENCSIKCMFLSMDYMLLYTYASVCCFFKKGEDFYSMEKLDYVYFVHSLCLIGRLLLYKDSRELFPVTLPNFDGRFNPPNIVLIISCFIKCYVVHPDQLQDLEGDFCNLICYFSNLIKS